ncbi:MAG: transposase [Clostridia bacterium]|nr:transposase [Clostridia bacterium]
MSLTEMKLESNSKIRIDFGGGNLSSDGGLLLLKEFLAKIGFERIAAAKFKTTDEAKRFHSDADTSTKTL